VTSLALALYVNIQLAIFHLSRIFMKHVKCQKKICQNIPKERIFIYLDIYSRVKNELLPRIRTFREITFFMLCVTRIFKSYFECLRLVTLN
jgi:hypothetical protein